MLGLKLKTDTRWAKLAESNLQELMTDHAFCEQKAASSAISLIVNYPEHSELVSQMSRIAQEEMLHFEQVHDEMLKRGWTLGRERKDPYVNDLMAFLRKGADRKTALLDRLLFAAMIEARSCERFRVLTETIKEEGLRNFYHELMISEAGHYTTFIKLAHSLVGKEETDIRWQEWITYEEEIISKYGNEATMHG